MLQRDYVVHMISSTFDYRPESIFVTSDYTMAKNNRSLRQTRLYRRKIGFVSPFQFTCRPNFLALESCLIPNDVKLPIDSLLMLLKIPLLRKLSTLCYVLWLRRQIQRFYTYKITHHNFFSHLKQTHHMHSIRLRCSIFELRKK